MIKKNSSVTLISNSSRRYINLLFSKLKNYIPGLILEHTKNYQILYFSHPRDVLLFYELLNFFDFAFEDYFKNWELTKEKSSPLSDANLELLDDNFEESFEDIIDELQPVTPTKRKKLHIKYKVIPYLFSDREYFEHWSFNQIQTDYIIHNALLENRILITENMFKNLLSFYDKHFYLQSFQTNRLLFFFKNYLKLLQYLFFINWMNKIFYLKLINVKFTTAR